jgi:hypothetical protein
MCVCEDENVIKQKRKHFVEWMTSSSFSILSARDILVASLFVRKNSSTRDNEDQNEAISSWRSCGQKTRGKELEEMFVGENKNMRKIVDLSHPTTVLGKHFEMFSAHSTSKKWLWLFIKSLHVFLRPRRHIIMRTIEANEKNNLKHINHRRFLFDFRPS